jgi:hypothetical protein
MKMSDYNWNWWFVLNIIALTIGLMVGMIAKNVNEVMVSNIILGCAMVSFIPCMYIGCKPSKD